MIGWTWRASVHQARAYVDTSVFGGTEDEEFKDASRRFLERVRRGEYRVLLSPVTYGELAEAPDNVQQVVRDLPSAALEQVITGDEARQLADAYIDAGAVGEAARDDALHVATATVAGADLIVSWNFRHIVNYDRIRKFNAVNLMKGYRTVTFCSPLEVAYGDEDQDV
jgi:predicted nucleic acid-binding protein